MIIYNLFFILTHQSMWDMTIKELYLVFCLYLLSFNINKKLKGVCIVIMIISAIAHQIKYLLDIIRNRCMVILCFLANDFIFNISKWLQQFMR